MFGGPLTVERNHSPLKREVWEFYYFDDRHVLVVDTYRAQERETRRHKWKTQKGYARLHRPQDWGFLSFLVEEQVPMPEDVLAEARKQFMDRLRVTLWSKRHENATA